MRTVFHSSEARLCNNGCFGFDSGLLKVLALIDFQSAVKCTNRKGELVPGCPSKIGTHGCAYSVCSADHELREYR
jgi:hypothetical protein